MQAVLTADRAVPGFPDGADGDASTTSAGGAAPCSAAFRLRLRAANLARFPAISTCRARLDRHVCTAMGVLRIGLRLSVTASPAMGQEPVTQTELCGREVCVCEACERWLHGGKMHRSRNVQRATGNNVLMETCAGWQRGDRLSCRRLAHPWVVGIAVWCFVRQEPRARTAREGTAS